MAFIADNQFNDKKIPQLKILVVDDDVLNQRMMHLLLTREGHLVDLVANGLEAFEAIKIKTYDVVFMDLQMPVMDGIEASRRIREWENGGQHTFLVALTASYLPENGHVLFEAGIDNYISKPFEMEQVQRLLKYGFQARVSNESVQPKSLAGELPPEKVLDFRKGIVQVGGDENMYRELLSDFIAGLPKRLRAIQQYFAERNLVELARTAHNLSGIAANLGASQLSDCAKKLDKQSVEGYTESLDPLVQEIQLVVARLLEFSNNFLAQKQVNVESV
ncbi:MAG TPA: response regulator [Anaerolineales bacterium]|nr:response regulator [Anaerolineales bacterium]